MRVSKGGKLCFFNSFEKQAGQVFFLLDVTAVEEGGKPDARRGYEKTDDQ